MKLTPSLFAFTLVGLASTWANADIIETSGGTTYFNVSAGMGQSFTADSTVVNLDSFVFLLYSNDPNATATAQLYSGGNFNSLMDTASVTFPSFVLPTNSPVPFDFSGNTLVDGNMYSVRVSSVGGLNLWTSDQNPYSGGMALNSAGAQLGAGQIDFRFAVFAAVPEPSTLGLLGAIGMIALRCRTKTLE